MGTSISHGSPRTTNWKPVLACYIDDKFPKERIISEVWRASEKEATPISEMMKSDTIFRCYNAVIDSENYRDALQKFNDIVLETKQNSIVAEFAKRVIPLAFQSNKPAEQWRISFFSEFTNYVVSRDVSGFVGNGLRNQSVTDLIEFKKSISNKVNQIVSANKAKIKNKRDWNNFIDTSILKLKTAK